MQAQVAANENNFNWWVRLAILLLGGLIVAWLLGREASNRPLQNQAAHSQTKTTTESTIAGSTKTATVRGETNVVSEPHIAPAATAATRDEVATTPATANTLPQPSSAPVAEPTTPAATATPLAVAEPDNLTVVNGIGPKINQILHEAGITTYQELANAEVDAVKQILVDAGLRSHDPTTWPEQAGYAMRGDWDDLKAFQSQLSSARRD